jgi:AcrR family transcriptional regulator
VSTARDIARRRRSPVQKRSRETFDNICAAASEILNERGLEALNTNAVAERAGVSITAVYAYFPDKYAIMHELFIRSDERWRIAVMPMFEAVSDTDDLVDLMRQTTLTSAKTRVNDPEYRALRNAIWAVPELAELERAILTECTDLLATELRRRQPRLTPRRATRAAQTIVLSAAAAVDDCARAGCVDRPLLEQVSLMSGLYVEQVLSD